MYKTKSPAETKHQKDIDSDTKATKVSKDQEKGELASFIKDQSMIKILNKKGIVRLFPIQYQTFNLIHKGEDVVAKDRTGSGKTLAFSLPTIIRMREQSKFKGTHPTKFLIVLPTRQLAIQVKQEISSLRLRDQQDFSVVAIYGGNQMQQQLELVSKGADIIVATPGRLLDFLQRGSIKLNQLQIITLDEADQMLKIGFKEDIQKIFQFITKARVSMKNPLQCLLFSATIPEWIWEISDRYQSKNKKFIDMIKDSNIKTSKTVEHYCMKANPMQKQAYIGSIMKYFLKGKRGKTIIFCQTKRQVDRIGNSGLIPCSLATLHGDVKQFIRQKVFRKFKNGEVQCLIATNVAARGLDFPQIDLIIQIQPPPNSDAYIHRSGRTGRAGKSGVCVTFYSYRQEQAMNKIQRQTKILLHHINIKELKPVTSQVKSSYEEHRERNRSTNERDHGRDNQRSQRNSNRFNNRRDQERQNDRGYSRDDKGYSKNDRGYSRDDRKFNGRNQDNTKQNLNGGKKQDKSAYDDVEY